MGKLNDILQKAKREHHHAGYRLCGDNLILYYVEKVGRYRGEDSGAWYPEYGDDILFEKISLEPYVSEITDKGDTIQTLIDKHYSQDLRGHGDWYNTWEEYYIFNHIDNIL